VTHVEGRIDPVSDADTVETELMLADLESLERRRSALEKKAKGNDKEAKATLALVDAALVVLAEGRPARTVEVAPEEQSRFRQLQLLTAKPVLYVCNVDENSAGDGNAYSRRVEERAKAEGAGHVVISAKIESELAQLAAEERAGYLESLGLDEPGLNRLIRAGYKLLGLITYFTVGPKEARAWTIMRGTAAPQAAAVIHSDFEKGFIRAETIGYEDFVQYNGEVGAKEAGRMRLEGKEYVVNDGDILHFRTAN
jgi:ribosome-binding ATPase